MAVAVKDVEPGQAHVAYLDDSAPTTIDVNAPIPLGHKVALRAVAAGDDVTEYGLRVAIASADISKGDYVHTHNVRSARWHNSVA
ncbi:UxaA family hydrolase [Micromonospora yasonensis]|uniref:UxaA family hydrolase n=1 Tax=Micromonospora yasonensis TaxID=1128667 RepID=UPI00222FBBFD|nr:UxaA family hydrolase [Micromonospora yasonensis]MCW3840699.1 UxaA family hydrolase [Micromonospora yasonensis]